MALGDSDALQAMQRFATGQHYESYTMLTLNADGHPLMGRMHKPELNPVAGLVHPQH